jgi:hypothetical protein
VTLFPAETANNTCTVSPNRAEYRHSFVDLVGGRTEYVLTIACMIGKSRMKGAKHVANLVPYGPERPSNGMTKAADTKQVIIAWLLITVMKSLRR